MIGTVEGAVLIVMIVVTALLLLFGDWSETLLEWLLSKLVKQRRRYDNKTFQAVKNADQVAKTDQEARIVTDREREVRLPLFDNREEF